MASHYECGRLGIHRAKIICLENDVETEIERARITEEVARDPMRIHSPAELSEARLTRGPRASAISKQSPVESAVSESTHLTLAGATPPVSPSNACLHYRTQRTRHTDEGRTSQRSRGRPVGFDAPSRQSAGEACSNQNEIPPTTEEPGGALGFLRPRSRRSALCGQGAPLSVVAASRSLHRRNSIVRTPSHPPSP